MTLPLSETRNLRTGAVPWDQDGWTLPPASPRARTRVDVAILGSGIMGAILAERLADGSRSVALFDRRQPGCGSTAASTAEVMWAMDVPLLHLGTKLGEAEAARRWRRVFAAVRELADRIDALGDCGERIERPTLYLAGNVLGEAELAEEAALHQRFGLPSAFLTAAEVSERFGIAPRAAILSDGGYEIDPVALCHALLWRAIGNGAALTYPADVVALHPTAGGVELECSTGHRCVAAKVVLATGYERARLFLPPAFKLISTFAIATPPGTAPLWGENAMIWEAADPYLYVRTDIEGRIIAGGEDIETADETRRDALIEPSAGRIAAKLEALLNGRRVMIDRAWGATFGFSPDGLPAIGPTSLMPDVCLAAGYGGNGIAFAALAAQMLERSFSGEPDPDLGCFDPYRFT